MSGTTYKHGRHNGADGFIMPPALKAGDTVAIVAPSGWIMPEFIEGAAARLKAHGWNVVTGCHTAGRNGTFAGTVAERGADLAWALTEPSVKAVFCGRGGYGTVHLLQQTDALPLRDNARWLVGYSDITALHGLMHANGIMSLHAPMARHLATMPAGDQVVARMFDILEGRLTSVVFDASELNRCGRAQGRLAGGNLAVMSGMAASPFDMIAPGTVLFIEDIGEPVYRIERMLWQLKLSGALERLGALIVGQFTGEQRLLNGMDAWQVIAAMVEGYDYPVAFNAPVGHVTGNVPLVEGARVSLNVEPDAVTLNYL